jgi:hypothetical protein
MTRWIDVDSDTATAGTLGYLVHTTDTRNGCTERWSLRDRPLRTNMSHEPRLHDWCGSDSNVSRTACGVARIVRVNAAGDRAQIVDVTGPDLAAFLERDGYPELLPEGTPRCPGDPCLASENTETTLDAVAAHHTDTANRRRE